jgi:hypothetical protein
MGTAAREATELSVQHPHVDLWLQPEYGAGNKAVETLAITDGLRATTRNPDSAARITLTCDDVITCRPLRMLFAPRLRLVVPDGPDRSVARPLPLSDPRELEELLDGIGHPEATGELARGSWVLVPFTPSTFLRRLPENEALLHAMLWIAQEEPDFALDPWAYTDLNEQGMPTWGEVIRWYELDADRFAAAIAEVMADALPEIWADDEAPTLAASCRRAVSLLRHDLEPALRDYEDGELTSLLEAATALREKLEAVTKALLSGHDGAEDGHPSEHPTRQRP